MQARRLVTQVWLLPLALALMALLLWSVPWQTLAAETAQMQRELHRLLGAHVNRVAAEPWLYGPALMGISFLYGVFHAVGPGHGKAVMLTYLGSQSTSLRSAALLSLAGALLQSLVAIVLVSVMAMLVKLSLRRINHYGEQIELFSYALVALLGAMLVYRAIQGWRRLSLQVSPPVMRPEPVRLEPVRLEPVTTPARLAVPAAGHVHSASCGCQHALLPAAQSDWREKLLLVISMGMRPCTGALLVLMYAYITQVHFFGIAATLVMGLGTGLSIALMALLTVLFRQRMLRFAQRPEALSAHSLSALGLFLALLGGVFLMLFGASLFFTLSQASSTPHPLF